VSETTWQGAIGPQLWLDDNGRVMADCTSVDHNDTAVLALLDEKVVRAWLDTCEDLLAKATVLEAFWTGEISDEVGERAARSVATWRDLKDDPCLAYARRQGAIRVAGNSFTVWRLDKRRLVGLQAYLLEARVTGRATVEEYLTGRSVTVPVEEVLAAGSPGELWRSGEASGRPAVGAP